MVKRFENEIDEGKKRNMLRPILWIFFIHIYLSQSPYFVLSIYIPYMMCVGTSFPRMPNTTFHTQYSRYVILIHAFCMAPMGFSASQIVFKFNPSCYCCCSHFGFIFYSEIETSSIYYWIQKFIVHFYASSLLLF